MSGVLLIATDALSTFQGLSGFGAGFEGIERQWFALESGARQQGACSRSA